MPLFILKLQLKGQKTLERKNINNNIKEQFDTFKMIFLLLSCKIRSKFVFKKINKIKNTIKQPKYN